MLHSSEFNVEISTAPWLMWRLFNNVKQGEKGSKRTKKQSSSSLLSGQCRFCLDHLKDFIFEVSFTIYRSIAYVPIFGKIYCWMNLIQTINPTTPLECFHHLCLAVGKQAEVCKILQYFSLIWWTYNVFRKCSIILLELQEHRPVSIQRGWEGIRSSGSKALGTLQCYLLDRCRCNPNHCWWHPQRVKSWLFVMPCWK